VSVDSSGLAGSGDSVHPSLSANGQIVAFSSLAPDLVPGDTNGHADAFVHDRATGVTERVSVASTGAEGNDGSWADSISADGQIVAFYGWSSNLVAGDANGVSDVFVRDRTHGLTERVSVDSTGAEATDHSYYPSLSADGRIVAFWSLAANLVAGDTNGRGDVFVRDRSTGTTERDSVDASGAEGDDHSYEPALSARGVIVAFCSAATNLVAGDTNGVIDVFVHHRRIDATWFPYGTGWPGTLGAPDAASSGDPVLGTSITITITNSLGADTPGVVLVGLAQANLPTGKDGTLLVVPLLYIPLLVPSAGAALNVTIPDHDSLSGLEVDLQTLELDAGASKGVSFTRGLKLVLGQ